VEEQLDALHTSLMIKKSLRDFTEVKNKFGENKNVE